ncbi:hypothetical protein GQ53DRAFT_153611 [Thozetella sp. PMI_491]|nr:hypothetical protein GQ53DRAFT_153611 [Thozetella sp. PMI_491]
MPGSLAGMHCSSGQKRGSRDIIASRPIMLVLVTWRVPYPHLRLAGAPNSGKPALYPDPRPLTEAPSRLTPSHSRVFLAPAARGRERPTGQSTALRLPTIVGSRRGVARPPSRLQRFNVSTIKGERRLVGTKAWVMPQSRAWKLNRPGWLRIGAQRGTPRPPRATRKNWLVWGMSNSLSVASEPGQPATAESPPLAAVPAAMPPSLPLPIDDHVFALERRPRVVS